MVGTGEDLRRKIFIGNKILFAKYNCEEIEMNNLTYKILQHSDLIAVI